MVHKDYHVKDNSIILCKQYVMDLLDNKSCEQKRFKLHVREMH